MLLISRDPGGTSGVGSYEMTEAERRVADVVKYGVVTAVDYSDTTSPRVRVGIGDSADEDGYIETDWLPMATGRSNEWNPLKVGESALIHSESGELQNGVVGHSIHNDTHPAPGNRPDLWRKQFTDGSVIEYDEAAGALKFTSHTKVDVIVGDASLHMENGSLVLTAGGQTLTLDSGGLKHGSKNVGDTHTHTDPQGGITGAPV
jgi:phage baseplate assembly protein V